MLREWLFDADWYYGWVVALAGFVSSTVLFGLTYSFGVFLDPLSRAFPVGSGTLSLLFGVQTFVIYAGSVPAGSIVDTVGARRTAFASTVLITAGLLGASTAGSFWVLLAWYGVLVGLGMSLLYVVTYTAVPRWFHRHRGLATGIASSGLGIGLLVVAPLSAWLIARFGWRDGYLFLGVGAGVTLLVATYFFDDPDVVDPSSTDEFPSGTLPSVSDTPLRERLEAVGTVAASWSFVALFLGWLFIWSPLYVLMNHVVRFATVTGLTAATGVAAISLIGVTTSVSRIAVGSASDRLGRVRTFVVSGALVTSAVPALTLVEGRTAFFVVAAIFGVGYGGAGALLSPLAAELFGGENLGTIFGTASVAFAIGGLSAPPLAGILYGWAGSYTPVFWAAGAVGLLGVALTWAAGRWRLAATRTG